jgi:hypothetical protein
MVNMAFGLIDVVESGDYKGGEIKLKGLTNKPTLIKKGFLGKTVIKLDKSTIKNYEVVSTQTVVGTTQYRSKIDFKDGKSCIVHINYLVHDYIMKDLG